MTTVHAAQHIYTNVEKEQSPQNRSGYQTLFYTQLEAGEAASLPRLMSYLPGQAARELRRIEKILDRQPDIPEPFQRAVSDAIAALPPARRGLQGLFHAWLGHGQASRESNDKMAH